MIKPCPFCGKPDIAVLEGSTFRWRVTECSYCGARGPEVRAQTTGEGDPAEWASKAWQKAIDEWNTRAAAGGG